MLVFKMWVYNLEKENVETDKGLMDENKIVKGHSKQDRKGAQYGVRLGQQVVKALKNSV